MRVRSQYWVMLLLLTVAIVLCLPALFINNSILGIDEAVGDRANTLWLQWILYTSENPGEHIFAPVGVSLQTNYFNLLDAYLAMPFVGIFGWPDHYNIVILVIALCNGMCAYLFARFFTKNTVLAAGIAILFMSSEPFVSAVENGRLIQAVIGVLPLACWGIWRFHSKPSLETSIVAAMTVGIAGWFYLYFGYALAIISVYSSITNRNVWRAWYWLLVFYLLAGGIAWLLIQGIDDNYLLTTVEQSQAFPSPGEMLSPRYFGSAGAILDHSVPIGFLGWSSVKSLPFLLTVLAVIGWFSKPRDQKIPLVFLFSILALGPYLHNDQGIIGLSEGALISSPLYLWLHQYVPMIDRMHWPERWLGVLATLLIPAAVIAMERFEQWRHWLLLGVFVSLGLDAYRKDNWPLSYTLFEVPSCYVQLREKPDASVLISPFVFADRGVVYQPIHRKDISNPIGSGYDEKKWLPEYRQRVVEQELVQWLRTYDHPSQNQTPLSDDAVIGAKKAGIGYLVHHWSYLKDALDDPSIELDHGLVEQRVRAKLISTLGEPSCVDSQIAIWQL